MLHLLSLIVVNGRSKVDVRQKVQLTAVIDIEFAETVIFTVAGVDTSASLSVSVLKHRCTLEVPFKIHIKTLLPFISTTSAKTATGFRIIQVPGVLAEYVINPDPEGAHGNQAAGIVEL